MDWHGWQHSLDWFPLVTQMVAPHRREGDNPTPFWQTAKQIAVTVFSGIAIAIITAVASTMVTLRVLDSDVSHLREEVKETKAALNNSLNETKALMEKVNARLERHVENYDRHTNGRAK